MLSALELSAEYHEGGLQKSTEQEARGYAFAYSNRWNPVWEAIQELDASTLEAEALWGQPIRQATDQLRTVAREVNIAIDALIADAASGRENFASDRDFGSQIRATVSALPTDSANSMNMKMTDAILAIDDQLRAHLQRS